MTVTTEKNTEQLPIGVSPATAAISQKDDAQVKEANTTPTRKTKGEKLFDAFVYIGLGYVANFIASVVVGHFFIKGRGIKAYEKTETFLEQKLKPILRDDWSKKIAEGTTRIGFIGAGGHIVMIPIKLLEDRKKRFVYWLNSKFFPEEYKGQVPIKPLSEIKDEEIPNVVEQPSKISWWKTVERRAIIYFGIAFGFGALEKINHAAEHKIKIGVDKGLEFAHKTSGVESLDKLRKSQTFKDYMDIGAADLYLSAAVAFLIKLTNGAHGFFGKKNDKNHPETKQDSSNIVASDEAKDERFAEAVSKRSKSNVKTHASHASMIVEQQSKQVSGLAIST